MATEAERRLRESQRALGLTSTAVPSRYTDAEDRAARREVRNQAKRDREAARGGATSLSAATGGTLDPNAPATDEDVEEAIRSIKGNAEEKEALASVLRSLGMAP